MLPAVGKADESTRLKRFHQRENLEVGSSFNVRMGGADGVFLHDENSFAEEVREDSDTVGLGNEHDVGAMELFWIIERSGRILSKQNTKSLSMKVWQGLVKSDGDTGDRCSLGRWGVGRGVLGCAPIISIPYTIIRLHPLNNNSGTKPRLSKPVKVHI